MTVKDALESDAPSLATLIHEIYDSTDYMCQEFSEAYPNGVNSVRSEIQAQRASRGGLFLIAEEKGRLAGYVTLKPNHASKLSHTGEVNMGVDSAFRGRGTGQLLIQTLIERVRAEGAIEIIYLHVRADNTAGVALYESNGFERLARLDNDTKIAGRHYDGLLYRLRLDDPAAAALTI